jgi:hypothetical protein
MDHKMVTGLIATVVVLALIGYIVYTKNGKKEGFLTGMRFAPIAQRVAVDSKGLLGSIPLNSSIGSCSTPNYFVSNASYQGMLSPRNSGGVGLGSLTRYKLPDYDMMGVPDTPLGGQYTPQTTESYTRPCAFKTQDPNLPPPGFASGNYNQEIQSIESGESHAAMGTVPVGTTTTVTATGEPQQVLMMDRLMYSAAKGPGRYYDGSGLAGLAVRGSLAIAPNPSGWFTTSANPALVLEQSALSVLGGNDTSAALFQLKNLYAGNTLTTYAGAPISDLSPQTQASLGIVPVGLNGQELSLTAAGGDIYGSAATGGPTLPQRTAVSFL